MDTQPVAAARTLLPAPSQGHSSSPLTSPLIGPLTGPSHGCATDPDLATCPWLALGAPDVLQLRRPHGRAVRKLPSGSRVCLVEDRFPSRLRLRRVARSNRLQVERELVVLPSIRHPLVLLDDDEATVGRFWGSVATVPPGLGASAFAVQALLRVCRALPWRWTGALAPGRAVIGTLP